ncbi:hypothetical protein CHUAL_006623 [Chamberlinius hualienensis]
MEKSFEGKRALVTGAGQGIGKAVTLRLLQYKAEVIAVVRDATNLQAFKNEIGNLGQKLEIVSVDISDWNATRRALEAIKKPIDLLVNNAGVTVVKPFLEHTESDIDFVASVNLKAPINVAQVVAKGMIERGSGGAIVNVSSNASFTGLLNHTIYCGTKAGLDGVTRVMANELGRHNIRVNSVNPTVVMTDMGRKAWGDPVVAAPLLNRIPLGRFVEVDEVVNTIVFLLSDSASIINGVSFPVDGGLLAA